MRKNLRMVFNAVFGWSFTLVFALFATTIALLTLRLCWRWLTPLLLRFWGNACHWLQGVRLEVEGREHLAGCAPRIATFNHSSSLDAILIPVLWPHAGTAVVKREFLRIPFVGWAVWSMGFLFVDRGRSERARRVIDETGARIRDERLTVFIAPEGTRSRDGAFQPFKRGAFHLAAASHAPIVPIVISGAYEVYPRQAIAATPGVVRVRILPPIPTDHLTTENLGAFADELRARYTRELEDMLSTARRAG